MNKNPKNVPNSSGRTNMTSNTKYTREINMNATRKGMSLMSVGGISFRFLFTLILSALFLLSAPTVMKGENVSIATQPQSQTVVVGGTVTFTVEATGAESYKYQWYRYHDANPSYSISGATENTYTIENVGAGDAGSYCVKVQDSSDSTRQNTSTPATLTVLDVGSPFTENNFTYKITSVTSPNYTVEITALSDTSATSVTIPATVTHAGTTFTVTAIAASVFASYSDLANVIFLGNYQTQFGTTTAFSGLSGATGWYKPDDTTWTTGDPTPSITGLTLKPWITIATQPANRTVAEGQTATFSVALSSDVVPGGVGTPTYQWQSKAPGASDFSNVSGGTGADAASYATAGTEANGTQYRVVVSIITPGTASVTSTAATLTVSDAFTESGITYQITDVSNHYVTITGTTGDFVGGALTIDTVTHNTVPYNVTAIGTISDETGVFENKTDVTSVTIGANVTTIGKNAFKGCNNASFTAITIPTGVTSIGANAFKDCFNLANVIFLETTQPTVDSTSFATGCSGGTTGWYNPAWSLVPTITGLTLKPWISIATQPVSKTVAEDQTATFSVAVESAPDATPTYQWQKSTDNGSNWSPISGATSASYTTPVTTVADDNTQYQVVVSITTPGVASVTSSVAILSVGSGSHTEGGIKYVLKDPEGENPGTATFVGYEGNSQTSVIIPDKITVAPTVAIVAAADGDTEYIITGIDPRAFEGKTALVSVTVGSSITSVGTEAFKGCTALKNVLFKGNKPEYIGGGVFTDCSVLLKDSGSSPFVSYVQTATGWTEGGLWKDGETVKTYKQIVLGGTFTVPPFTYEMTSLTPYTAKIIGCTLTTETSVTIPETVNYADKAFNVTEVNGNSFKTCTSLATIELASGQNNFTVDSGILYSKDGRMLIACPPGKTGTVVIPAGVTQIAAGAFSGCHTLEIVFLGDQPKALGEVFNAEPTGLSIKFISNSIGWRDGRIWNGVPTTSAGIKEGNLTYLLFSNGTAWVTGYDGTTQDLSIPYSVTASTPFSGNYIVTGIADGAFKGNTTITNITFAAPVGGVAPLTHIGAEAFSGCTGLQAIEIPEKVSEIGANAFKGCTTLKTVTLDAKPTIIGTGAFEGCTTLENVKPTPEVSGSADESEVIIPNSLTEIADNLFKGCSAIKNVEIPSSILRIGANAFDSTGLTGVEIPASVETIEDAAFYNCTSLGNVLFLGAQPAEASFVFYNTPSLNKIQFVYGSEGWIDGGIWCNKTTEAVYMAPEIVEGLSDKTLIEGNSVTLGVIAIGSDLGYQWYKDGVAIPGAVGSSYTIKNATAQDSGTYGVTVKNAKDYASSSAVITVVTTPTIIEQPESCTVASGTSATFTVVATGSALTYQWYKDGAEIAGATNATYTITNVTGANAGIYWVTVSNAAGTATSSKATLAIDSKKVRVTRSFNGYVPGGTADVTLTVTGSVSLSSIGITEVLPSGWSFNSVVEDGGVDIVPAEGKTGRLEFLWNTGDISRLPITLVYRVNVPEGAAGGYKWSGSFDWAGATEYLVNLKTGGADTLDQIRPTIIVPPESQSVAEGISATFRVEAEGSDLKYQWYEGTNEIPGATGASYTISSVVAADAGTYTVKVWNTAGSERASASLKVLSKPVITKQPTNQTVNADSTVTFEVKATGSDLVYQWYKDGEKIEGATGSSVTIVSVSEEDAGIYTVTVGNALAKVTGSPATLTVLPKPVVSVTRSFPMGYIPNKTADVTLTINCTDNTLALSTLTYNEILPTGWTFKEVVKSVGTMTAPSAEATGTLTFEWTAVPAVPFSITYRVNVPGDAIGEYEWDGTYNWANASYTVTGAIIGGETAMKRLYHSTDYNRNWAFDISEMVRVSQLYKAGGYSMADDSVDAYQPRTGTQTGTPHSGDYNGDWTFGVGEMVRISQIYKAGGYHLSKNETIDGYEVGPEGSITGAVENPLEIIGMRSFADNGETIDISITIDGEGDLSSLALTEILPAGWTFNSMIEDGGMDLMPKSGSEGELNFVWFLSDIPELPFTVTYRVNVPEEYGFYEWYGEICAAGWTGDPETCDIDGDNQVTFESIE